MLNLSLFNYDEFHFLVVALSLLMMVVITLMLNFLHLLDLRCLSNLLVLLLGIRISNR